MTFVRRQVANPGHTTNHEVTSENVRHGFTHRVRRPARMSLDFCGFYRAMQAQSAVMRQ